MASIKSQDIYLLLKLVAVENAEIASRALHEAQTREQFAPEWEDWWKHTEISDRDEANADIRNAHFSVRALAAATGVSKSETSAALRRCYATGLAVDEAGKGPRANTKRLYEFIVYGLKYVFPVSIGPVVRGVPTAASAPVLSRKLFAGARNVLVWEDPLGPEIGQKVDPLFRTAPKAVRSDAGFYAILALVDSIRLGHGRESALAGAELQRILRG